MKTESAEQQGKSKGRTLRGTVVSDKMDKTIVVRITWREKHPLYGKIMSKSAKYHVHDANNSCKTGDFVLIQESRPISKTKNWQFVERLEQV
jgi:small subunit ribosomal protein S17